MCVHAQWVSLQRPLRTEHVKSSQVKSSQVKSNSRRSRIRLLWVARRRESGGRGAAQLAWLDSPEPGGLIIHSHVFMHVHVHIVFRSLNRLIIVVFYSSSSCVIQLATSRRPDSLHLYPYAIFQKVYCMAMHSNATPECNTTIQADDGRWGPSPLRQGAVPIMDKISCRNKFRWAEVSRYAVRWRETKDKLFYGSLQPAYHPPTVPDCAFRVRFISGRVCIYI